MATDRDKILIKSAVVSAGAYVSAKGAGTLTDVGATLGGVSVQVVTQHKRVEADQHLGELLAVPFKRTAEIKFVMIQSEIEKWRISTGQPAANKSGTPPNETLLVDANAGEEYFQMQIVGKGVGTTKVRTITAWRCFFAAVEAIALKKDDQQMFSVTIGVLEETTGTGADSLFKVVDT